MKSTIMTAAVATAISTMIACDSTQAASVYSVTELGIAQPTAINESTQVVGGNHIWSNGTASSLGSLGVGGCCDPAMDINDAGQVVGFSQIAPSGPDHPFLWENGVLTDLGTLGGDSGVADGINNAGKVVGRSTLRFNNTSHAFRQLSP